MDFRKITGSFLPLPALLMMLACSHRSAPEPIRDDGEPTRGFAALTPNVDERRRGPRHYQIQRFSFTLSETIVEYVDLEFERDLIDALDEPHAMLVINGGFWSPGGEPEGLSVDRRGTLSEYDEDLGGGVLVITAEGASIHDGEAYAPDPNEAGTLNFAIQAKPRLVVRGILNTRDDGRFADRTALCVPTQRTQIEVVVARGLGSSSGPSLFEFGEDLIELGCQEALNLDGGPSTGVAYRSSSGLVAQEPRTHVRLALKFSVRRPAP